MHQKGWVGLAPLPRIFFRLVLQPNKGLRAASRVSCCYCCYCCVVCLSLSYLVTKSKVMGPAGFLISYIAYCSFGDWGPGAGWPLFIFLRRTGTGDVG